MNYELAPDIENEMYNIIENLDLHHIKKNKIKCVRSYGSKSRRTIARCHSVGKVIQKALGMDAFYVLEFISRRFDNQSREDKTKTIIHELLHVPKTFGGGFRHHNLVTERLVNKLYKKLKNGI